MLEIKVNNTSLDLFPDTEITFSQKSNLFNFDNIEASYSLPINLPLSINNNKILNYPYILGVKSDCIIDCSIWVNGLLLYNGKMTIDIITDKTIDCNINFDFGFFSEKLKEKLNHLDIYGGDIPFEFPYYGDRDMTDPEELDQLNMVDWSVPQFNIIPTNDLNSVLVDVPNKNNSIDGYFYVHYQNTYTYLSPVVPMVKVRYILECIANYLGLILDETDFFRLDPQCRLLIVNNKDIANYTINSIYNINLNPIDTFNIKNQLPEITISEFLQGLKNTFGLNIEINFNKLKFVEINDILINNEYIDFSNKLFKLEINHQPLPTGLCLEYEKDDDQMAKNYDIQNVPEILYTTDILNEAPPINDIVAINETATFAKIETGPFLYRYNIRKNANGIFVKSWEPLENLELQNVSTAQNFITNTNPNINIAIKTCPVITKANQEICSTLKMPLNTQLSLDKGILKLKLAFLNYTTDLNYNLCAFISHKDFSSNPQYALSLWGTTGLYHKFWENIWNYLKTIDKKVTAYVNLSQRDIMFLNFERKIKLENNLYYIDELEYTIDIKGNFSKTKLTLRQL